MKKGKLLEPGGISWKWLAGGLCSLVFLGGGTWLSYIHTQIASSLVQVAEVKEKISDQKVKQATTEQKVQDIDKKVDEVRTDVRDIKTILQQIQIDQQRQIREQKR